MRAKLVLIVAMASSCLRAGATSPLFARGYRVLPEPQRVDLRPYDFAFGNSWHLVIGNGVPSDSVAIESLLDDLKARHQLSLSRHSGSGGELLLEIVKGSVTTGKSQDQDRDAVSTQAYRIDLAPSQVHILANSDTGLFYGVETFIQLLAPRNGAFWLPEGSIVDWPDLQLRQIYWDDAHHLERMPELRQAIRQAAFFKINAFVIKLEGHFEFHSAPALVEPQALSPEQLQQLTDYGLRYHVQLIPYLDAPAHIAFILKHPEYAQLRAFPDSNYEMCVTNPNAIRLIESMYDDLLAANKGVRYFYLSTDEAYYVGLSDQAGCQESLRAKQLGSPGKVLAEFITTAANYLHNRGRTVVFWGEYPLKPADIASLPKHLINGETAGPDLDPVYRQHGILQTIYNSTQGEEPLFPHYFLRPPTERLHPLYEDYERIPTALNQIAADSARRNSDLIGIVIAGWADAGLHPETCWLGYATITAAGWKQWSGGPQEAMSTFYPLFYGAAIPGISRIYQLMSYQAQIWTDSWETRDSNARKPIWGDSEGPFHPPKAAHDQFLTIPPSPDARLHYTGDWALKHQALITMTNAAIPQNDELQSLLRTAIPLATANRYNLDVFLSIARLCRQNLDMVAALAHIDKDLKQADDLARSGKPPKLLPPSIVRSANPNTCAASEMMCWPM